MAKNNSTPKLERPCSACHHLHDGIPCMEDGCECKKSVPAVVPTPAPQVDTRTDSEVISEGGEPAGGNTERNDGAAGLDMQAVEGDPAASQQPYDAGLRNTLPLQERVANVIEDFEAESGRWPVGCELVISGKVYTWTGEKMEEAPESVPEPPAAASTRLSEDDQAKLREFFAEQSEVKELPDGSVMLPLRVDVDQLEILKAWAEGAGEHWVTFAQRTLEMGLNAVINGGQVAG
jgi:hypothetical protein